MLSEAIDIWWYCCYLYIWWWLLLFVIVGIYYCYTILLCCYLSGIIDTFIIDLLMTHDDDIYNC